ncbi:MAG: tetratricopeptide repeat protein, partial [Micromonosporaceae bacterium]
MDIDQFFTLGPDGPFRAHQVFTNREEHLETLRHRLAGHARRRWPTQELLDFSRPATNVAAFTGEGGIGKSTLVRHAVKLAVGGEWEELPEHRAAAVIDFDDSASSSFESIVLRVRAALAPLAKRWPAFDLALAVYWERKHPGESLTGFLNKSSLAGSRRMAEQVGGALDELLGGFGLVSIAYRAVELLRSSAMKASRLKRLRRELPALEPILDEPDPDRMLGYLPVLLAADLERSRTDRPALGICLLDTFENVQRLAAERGGLEDLVSRLVYLMPNVFFAVASRRPLQWHEPVRSVGLTYGGEPRWPGLHDDDQHPLGGFDETDADHYLTTRLTVDDQPAIPSPIRRRIVAGAAGSPLYLELSSNLYQQYLARDETPPAEEFGHPFPELVLRTMRDLSPADRDLLRAAALLEAFDEPILRTVLPAARERAVAAFLERQFVRHDPSVWPAYRLHANLRRGVRECDELTDDGWTDTERADRVLAAVRHLTDVATSVWDDEPGRGGDADGSGALPLRERCLRSVAAFLLGLHASAEHGVAPPGLGVMAYTLREVGHWQVLTSLPEYADRPDLARLATVARLAADPEGNAAEGYQRMRAAVGDHRTGEFTDYLCFELGSRAHFIGELDAADDYFEAIGSDGSPVGSDGSPVAVGALFGLAGNAMRRSEYARVAALMTRAPDSRLDRIRVNDMLGHVQLHNGRFTEAAALFGTALEQAERANAPLWAARATRHLAQAYMWYDADATVRLVPRARELNQSAGELNGVAQCDL